MRAAASSAGQAQQQFATAYRDSVQHVELDDAFSRLRSAVESHAGLLQKQVAVRVRNWLKKLDEETANVTWKKNRNAYARLLLEQLRCGKLAEPFAGGPPGGPLPTLPKHLAYAYKPARSGVGRAGSPVANAPLTAQSQQGGPQQLAPPQHQRQQQQQSSLSASQQLDAYLGRADFRRAQHAEEEEDAAVAAAWLPREAACTGSPAAAGGGGGRAQQQATLPGTRMQLRGAEGRRVDGPLLADVGWQPSKLELEAQLGASRERQAELTWRLQATEALLRQQAGLLGPGAAVPPLGSLLDAIDDGHVSPPRQRAGKKELEALIERYEAKRQQWRSPSWAAGDIPSKRRAAQPPLKPSDEAEILGQLDNFQRQTDTIRRALGGTGGSSGSPRDGGPSPRRLASSLAAHTSDWGVLQEGTPMRQHPTGLRGGGYTPHPGAGGGGGGLDLFDGLPPSPAMLSGTHSHANRHVHHAGHHGPSGQPQPTQPAVATADSRRSPAAAAVAAPEQQLPRSPIGTDVRHTKKSAAAAERAATSASVALQRLKSRRPSSASAPSPAADATGQQQGQQGAAVAPPEHAERTQASPPVQQQQQQSGPTPSPAAATPAAPPLPADSNAALMAEVRSLRGRLLQSLQKHAPELAAAATPPASPAWQQRQQLGPDWDISPSSSWRLAAAPAATAPTPASGRGSVWRLTDQSSGVGWPAAGGAASGAKYRLTDDDGLMGGLSSSLSGLGSGGSLAQLSSASGGGGGGSFSLEAFEAQTEALRRQLSGL